MPIQKKQTLSLMILFLLVACQNQLAARNDAPAEQPGAGPESGREQAAPAATSRGPADGTPSDGEPAGEPDDSSGSQWPMFRLNNRHTVVLGRGAILQKPVLRWQFDTGGVVESSPAIVDECSVVR